MLLYCSSPPCSLNSAQHLVLRHETANAIFNKVSASPWTTGSSIRLTGQAYVGSAGPNPSRFETLIIRKRPTLPYVGGRPSASMAHNEPRDRPDSPGTEDSESTLLITSASRENDGQAAKYGDIGGWDGLADFEGLPWWRRPSVGRKMPSSLAF